MKDEGGAPSLESKIESLKKASASDRKIDYAEYLLRSYQLREVLCFEKTLPKNLVYMMLSQVFYRHLKPEWVVFRLVELGLYYEVIMDSYPTKECRKECLERRGRRCVEYTTVCEEVTKNIEGLMPSEELIQVCRNLPPRL
jgi:hypothetical protein